MKEKEFVSILIKVDKIENLQTCLNDIINQNFKSIYIFFLIRNAEKLDYNAYIKSILNKYLKINIEIRSMVINSIKEIEYDSIGKYIAIINSNDENFHHRFKKQVSYLENHKDMEVCSCLQKLSYGNQDCEGNLFITKEEIDDAVKGGYMPLDIYTFMMRRELFIMLIDNCTSELKDEVDYLLYILRYAKIEKINEVLCKVKRYRIPYCESISMDYTLNSTNRIFLFNKKKYIESRQYILEMIQNSRDEKVICTENKENNINILVLIKDLDIGGTETYLFNLSKKLEEYNVKTFIISEGGVYEHVFDKFLGNIIKKKISFEEDFFDFVKDILVRNNINIICCHSDRDIKISLELGNRFNVPVVITLHGMFYSKDKIKECGERATRIIAVSDNIKSYYEYLIPEIESKIQVIYNGINFEEKANYIKLKEKLNIPEENNIIIYCSRLSNRKAQLALSFLEGFYNIAEKYKNTCALILGDGDMKFRVDDYIERINSLSGRKIAYSLGFVYDVGGYFNEGIAVCGTGRCALEGMSVSKPVIALGLGGCMGIVDKDSIEYIKKSNFGDHVIPDSKVEKINIKKCIDYLLENEDKRIEIGEWSRDYCRNNFDIDDMCKEVIDVFKDIIR